MQAPAKAQGCHTCRLADGPLPSVLLLPAPSPVPAVLSPLLNQRRLPALRECGSAMLLRAVCSGEGLWQGCAMRA
jgi:hypothetical protein